MTEPVSEGGAALAALDRVLASRPAKDGPAFVEATEHLCAMRAQLTVLCRAGSDRRHQLAQLNGIISATLSGHFPLGPIPWPVIERGRATLETMLKHDSDLFELAKKLPVRDNVNR